MKTPEEVASELRDKIQAWVATGPLGKMGADEVMPAIYWPISMLAEAITRDRREQAAPVLPLVKWALWLAKERPDDRHAAIPEDCAVQAAEQWLAEAEQAQEKG
jgi:hypothetical protein